MPAVLSAASTPPGAAARMRSTKPRPWATGVAPRLLTKSALAVPATPITVTPRCRANCTAAPPRAPLAPGDHERFTRANVQKPESPRLVVGADDRSRGLLEGNAVGDRREVAADRVLGVGALGWRSPGHPATRSPTTPSTTPGPTASTTPANSNPMMAGARRRGEPAPVPDPDPAPVAEPPQPATRRVRRTR